MPTYPSPPESIWIDLDATDDPLHGSQEGRFFHGYYGQSCYLPLYIFCGEHLLCTRLRESNIDAAAGSVEEFTRIVAQIRARWAQVEIVLRGDSGFCREDIMAWCEAQGVHFLLGLAKNNRLIKRIGDALCSAECAYHASVHASRVFEASFGRYAFIGDRLTDFNRTCGQGCGTTSTRASISRSTSAAEWKRWVETRRGEE